MKRICRFTLIELLACVAIIAILSAIGFGSYSYAMGKAKESASEALLKQLEAGMETIHAKYGFYPPCAEFQPLEITVANGVVTELECNGFKLKAKAGDKALEDFLKVVEGELLKQHVKQSVRDSEVAATAELEDAWGTKIYYRSPGKFNKTTFDLISAGPDGVFSSSSWKTAKADGDDNLDFFRDPTTDEWICADLANF